MLCYKMTDTQSIRSMCGHAAVIHDCMQLKVKIIVVMCNQLIITIEASLILSIKVGVAPNDQ